MQNRIVTIDTLTDAVISQLQKQGYSESSIANYRRIYTRLHGFMCQHDTESYSEEIGQAFLDSLRNDDPAAYAVAIRRINDCANGKPYRCHHGGTVLYAPAGYADILDHFLDSCKEAGNKPATIEKKKKGCVLFLEEVERLGCAKLSDINAQLLLRALLSIENKDYYGVCRQFLRYLNIEDITDKDYSGIVPHCKRRKPLPTTYTIEEISAIEDSIDTSTATGKRNFAIILLATRLGLRSGDIAKLQYSEIDFENSTLSIVQEKTGTPLSLHMPDDVVNAIKSHIECSKADTHDNYLFHSMSAPHGRLTTRIIRHLTQNAFKDAKIDFTGKKHGPHSFRSSLASSMVNDGVSYEVVGKILGHNDPDIIKHYAKSDIENLRLCAIEPPEPEGLFQEYLSGRRRFPHV